MNNLSFSSGINKNNTKIQEYLKLYSYLLLDYPVVVHLDLDTLVLKPMDDVFDIMIDPLYDRRSSNNNKFTKHHLMWKEEVDRINNGSGLIDFVFTRDYNMVCLFCLFLVFVFLAQKHKYFIMFVPFRLLRCIHPVCLQKY